MSSLRFGVPPFFRALCVGALAGALGLLLWFSLSLVLGDTWAGIGAMGLGVGIASYLGDRWFSGKAHASPRVAVLIGIGVAAGWAVAQIIPQMLR